MCHTMCSMEQGCGFVKQESKLMSSSTYVVKHSGYAEDAKSKLSQNHRQMKAKWQQKTESKCKVACTVEDFLRTRSLTACFY